MKIGKRTKLMIGISLMLCIWIGVWNNPAKADSYWDRSLVVGVSAVAAVILGIIVFFWLKMKKARRM